MMGVGRARRMSSWSGMEVAGVLGVVVADGVVDADGVVAGGEIEGVVAGVMLKTLLVWIGGEEVTLARGQSKNLNETCEVQNFFCSMGGFGICSLHQAACSWRSSQTRSRNGDRQAHRPRRKPTGRRQSWTCGIRLPADSRR